MDNKASVLIIVAIIGLIGTLGAAAISAGWNPFSAPATSIVVPPNSEPETGATPVPPDSASGPTSPPAQRSSTEGNWSSQVGDLELTVTKVEIVRSIGDKKILRFYMTVNNGTTQAVTLPVFGSFSAVDSSGGSYAGEPMSNKWPQSFPSGQKVSGSIELEDAVPSSIHTMSVNFSHIFGPLDLSGKEMSVSNISVP
jgi:hypothetical protein